MASQQAIWQSLTSVAGAALLGLGHQAASACLDVPAKLAFCLLRPIAGLAFEVLLSPLFSACSLDLFPVVSSFFSSLEMLIPFSPLLRLIAGAV